MSYEEHQKGFYEKAWSTLALSPTAGATGWQTSVPAAEYLEWLDSYLKHYPLSPALDLGCGAGRHTFPLAQRGLDTTGVDFSSSAIARCEEIARTQFPELKLRFQVGEATSLNLPDRSFQFVNDDGCLHHVVPAQWQQYLAEVSRVLQPGGVFRLKCFSSGCSFYEENRPTGSSSRWALIKDADWTYFFEKHEIVDLFSERFELLEIEERVHAQTHAKAFWFSVWKRV